MLEKFATNVVTIIIVISFIIVIGYILTLPLFFDTKNDTKNDTTNDTTNDTKNKRNEDNTTLTADISTEIIVTQNNLNSSFEKFTKTKLFCNANTPKVTFYDLPQFAGNSKEFCIGFLSSSDKIKIGSIKIPYGMSVELFDQPDLKGNNIKTMSHILDANEYDNIYSIRINTLDNELSNHVFNPNIID